MQNVKWCLFFHSCMFAGTFCWYFSSLFLSLFLVLFLLINRMCFVARMNVDERQHVIPNLNSMWVSPILSLGISQCARLVCALWHVSVHHFMEFIYLHESSPQTNKASACRTHPHPHPNTHPHVLVLVLVHTWTQCALCWRWLRARQYLHYYKGRSISPTHTYVHIQTHTRNVSPVVDLKPQFVSDSCCKFSS